MYLSAVSETANTNKSSSRSTRRRGCTKGRVPQLSCQPTDALTHSDNSEVRCVQTEADYTSRDWIERGEKLRSCRYFSSVRLQRSTSILASSSSYFHHHRVPRLLHQGAKEGTKEGRNGYCVILRPMLAVGRVTCTVDFFYSKYDRARDAVCACACRMKTQPFAT